MIVDIVNELFTELKTLLVGVSVHQGYPSTTPVFPCVTLEEIYNQTNPNSVDTYGEKVNDVSLEINIFTNSKTKMSDAKTIRNTIDSMFADKYRMERTFSNAVPNYMDASIYRYILRYDFSIDGNKKIYKR